MEIAEYSRAWLICQCFGQLSYLFSFGAPMTVAFVKFKPKHQFTHKAVADWMSCVGILQFSASHGISPVYREFTEFISSEVLDYCTYTGAAVRLYAQCIRKNGAYLKPGIQLYLISPFPWLAVQLTVICPWIFSGRNRWVPTGLHNPIKYNNTCARDSD